MKRTLALLTVIFLAVCLLAVSVSAQDPTATSTHRMQLVDASDNTGNLSVGSITGMPGKNITVPVTLDDNPGIISLGFEVEFDETVLTLVSVDDTGVFPGANHSDNLVSPYAFSWENDTSASDCYQTGVIAYMVFEVKEGTSGGVYPFSVNVFEDGILNKYFESVDLDVKAGSVTVSDYVLGDANGDGEVTQLDRLTLSRYLAKWKDYPLSAIKAEACDVNTDSSITAKDRIILSRYLAKWPGYYSFPWTELQNEDSSTEVDVDIDCSGHSFGYFVTDYPVLDESALVVGDDLNAIDMYIAQGYISPEYRFPRFAITSKKIVNKGVAICDLSPVSVGAEKTNVLNFQSTRTVDVEGCRPGWVSFQNGGATEDGDIVPLGLMMDDLTFKEGYEYKTDREGNYKNAYVIYDVDPETNEISILKTIRNNVQGSDTYVATGLLTEYSVANKSVTIGGKTFTLGNSEVAGSGFMGDSTETGTYLYSLFNLYVEYVVVDGKVVYIEPSGDEEFRFFVLNSLEDYCGASSDEYPVFTLFDTDTGLSVKARISKLDNVDLSDFDPKADYEKLFGTRMDNGTPKMLSDGDLFRITSYNPENDTYTVASMLNVNALPKQTGFTYTNADRTATSFSGEHTKSVADRDFVWFMIDYRFAKTDIQFYIYQGKCRPAPTSWGDGDTPWQASSGSNIPGSTNGLKPNMGNDKYVMIYASGEIAGSPVRVYEGKVDNSEWNIQGWRLVGTDSHTHIYVGLKAGDVIGFDTTKTADTNTLVMIPDYKDKNNRGENGEPDLLSWYRPELGHTSGWQIQWGNSGETTNLHPWGYVAPTDFSNKATLYGDPVREVTVLDLRTLNTVTIKTTRNDLKPNYIYEMSGDQVVGGPHNAGELYEFLLGSFGNNVCDLENDLTELYTTYYNLKDKYAAHESGVAGDNWVHAGYTILGTNQWMTEKWLGTAYADFGSYTINRQWANAAVIAVYEGNDGHVEITPLGMGGGKNQTTGYYIAKNGVYGEFPIKTQYNKLGSLNETVQHALTGSDDQDVNVVAVTVVNMDNAKLQRNLDPYKNGLAMITWLFDQKIVGELNHKFDK